jgi:hypothetical protein
VKIKTPRIKRRPLQLDLIFDKLNVEVICYNFNYHPSISSLIAHSMFCKYKIQFLKRRNWKGITWKSRTSNAAFLIKNCETPQNGENARVICVEVCTKNLNFKNKIISSIVFFMKSIPLIYAAVPWKMQHSL